MEPPQSPRVRIWLGEFPIVEIKPNSITINLGKNVHITMFVTGGVEHRHQVGEKLPLFSEIEYATKLPSIQ